MLNIDAPDGASAGVAIDARERYPGGDVGEALGY